MHRKKWLLAGLGFAVFLGSIASAVTANDRSSPTYVSSSACAGCHADEYRRWIGTDHDKAMQLPGRESVLAPFAGEKFKDVTFHSSGAAGEYWIDQGAMSYRVAYTFGVDPLQQYLVEFPGGRLQPFPYAWNSREKRWLEVRAEKLPGGDPFHWTGRYQAWNNACAECHSTAVKKNYDPASDTYSTTFAEIDVGCESCHGPGSKHVEWASKGGEDRGLVPIDRAAQVDTCARCHAHRSRLTAETLPGAPLADELRPTTLREELYFDDGQIKDEVFEYGSFAQSKMFQRGVVCGDCHDPHGLKADSSNALCLKCHDKSLDGPSHHKHAAGPSCADCHMPARTYMGADARRDHSFRVPRPDLSLAIGTPNACTQNCHREKDDIWAARTVAAWYPGEKPRHFGKIFYRARRGEDVTEELRTLAESNAPAIVRATALELLAAQPKICRETGLLNDPSPLVREAALSCGEDLPDAERARYISAALADESRLVRLEAARLSLGLNLPKAAAARSELEKRHRSQLDVADGWFNLGANAEASGDIKAATRYYLEALARDPQFLPAKVNLSRLR